jgi:hypothetical protein
MKELKVHQPAKRYIGFMTKAWSPAALQQHYVAVPISFVRDMQL